MFAPASPSRLGARQGKKTEGLLGLDVCIFYNAIYAICFPGVIQSAEYKPLTGTSFKLDRFGQMCLYLCLCFLLLISFISNPWNMPINISMYNYTKTHQHTCGDQRSNSSCLLHWPRHPFGWNLGSFDWKCQEGTPTQQHRARGELLLHCLGEKKLVGNLGL